MNEAKNFIDNLQIAFTWTKVKAEMVEPIKAVIRDFRLTDIEFSGDYTKIRRIPPMPQFKPDFDYRRTKRRNNE